MGESKPSQYNIVLIIISYISQKIIDILKMDIETYEWPVMEQLLQQGLMHSVRQLLIEWHIFPNQPMRTDFHSMYKTCIQLQDVGFRPFYKNAWSRHHSFEYFNSQMDNSMVNVELKS